ncbi:hypothetical protein MAJ_11527, partial [Metarhizium majus ARSEF 297]
MLRYHISRPLGIDDTVTRASAPGENGLLHCRRTLNRPAKFSQINAILLASSTTLSALKGFIVVPICSASHLSTSCLALLSRLSNAFHMQHVTIGQSLPFQPPPSPLYISFVVTSTASLEYIISSSSTAPTLSAHSNLRSTPRTNVNGTLITSILAIASRYPVFSPLPSLPSVTLHCY